MNLWDVILGKPFAKAPVPLRRATYVERFFSISQVVLDILFDEVELSSSGPSVRPDLPLVVYSNHPSFWDPLVLGCCLRQIFPERALFAPIESAEYARRWYFRGLGFFPVESSVSGLRRFQETAGAVLKTPGSCLVLTPEGKFRCPEQGPVRLKRGLAQLLSFPGCESVQTLPVALCYRLGPSPKPRAFIGFGDLESGPADTLENTHQSLERRLQDAVDLMRDHLAERYEKWN